MKTILDAPNPNTRSGIRDQAMLYLGLAAGLRASGWSGYALTTLNSRGPCRVFWSGERLRSRRRLPLWKEATRALRAWLAL